MALALKFELIMSSDCTSFAIKDLTGDYSATNTGGYGAPNPTIVSMTAATLTIPLSDGSTVVLGDSQGFYPAFPNDDDTLFTITSALLGLGANVNIADFVTPITYSMTNVDGTYSVTQYEFIDCNAKCCENKANAAIDFTNKCEPCDNKALQSYIKISALRAAVGNALECIPAQPNKATIILQSLTDICNQSGCGCGCG